MNDAFKNLNTEEEYEWAIDSMIARGGMHGTSVRNFYNYIYDLFEKKIIIAGTIKLAKPIKESNADLWEMEFGAWQHSSGYTHAHNKLGMAFAWWCLHEAPHDKRIIWRLGDSPDLFSRRTKTRGNWYGDIGQCTGQCFFFTIARMDEHNAWTTVVDYETLILLQVNLTVSIQGQSFGEFLDEPA